MKENNVYFDTNRKLWDAKTDIHVDSTFYDMKSFIKGATSLRKIELEELPDVNGKSLLHLQCHFGQDTLSLERLGAHCTGVDLSPNAINKAKEIRDQLNLKSKFICCNVYDTDKHINDSFDIVFTSYGTIIWLPDLNLWAAQIAKRLSKGGTFFMTEFHPVLYLFDWEKDKIAYDYFNSGEPIMEEEQGTYADTNAPIQMKEYFWQHSLADLFQALLNNGMEITLFKEYDYSPYMIFDNCYERAEHEYIFRHTGTSLPHVYTLKAVKK
jgi:SAM-dependent methyltransferase